MKKCPNCGACQECGHAPTPYAPNPYTVPVNPWPNPYIQPYPRPVWISTPWQVTWGSNQTNGPAGTTTYNG